MFDDPRLIQAFASGFAFFASSLLCFFLLTAGRKDRSARALVFALATMAIWGLFGFLFEIVPTEKAELARSLRIISVIFIAVLTASVNNFASTFYEEHIKVRKVSHTVALSLSYLISFVIVFFLLLDLSMSSGFMVKEVVLASNGALEPTPGPFFYVVYLYFFSGTLLTAYLLWKSRVSNSPFIKNQVTWMLLSVVVGLFAGGFRFATWYGIPGAPAIATLAAPIFGIGFFYAIAKHHLFNIRVITAEFLTFSIWAFLFLLIIFSETTEQRIINSVLFLATVVLGTFLVRGTLREATQKEELAKTNTALKNLNQNLEEIVRERTGELTRSKLHTEAIIENLVLGLIEYKSDFTVLRVNKAAEELLGFSRSNVVGKKITAENTNTQEPSSLAEVMSVDSDHESLRGNQAPALGITSETITQYPSPKNLQITTFRVASEEQGQTEEHGQFVKIIRDITREKLIDKNKSDFVTIVAHQLRTPLSAIKWVFNTALEDKGVSDTERTEALRSGSQSTERMIHLINDLLDLVSIEDGMFGYEFKQNDITKIVTKVVENMQERAQWKMISLEAEFPPEPLLPFVFDESRISLALTNVIENAIDYTPKNGSLHIHEGTNLILVEQGNNEVKISVKDTGMGIQESDMQKIMVTKFFRSTQAVRAETDGSGLGLFITKNIIQGHKGTITVESGENKGTTVFMVIPTTLQEADAPKLRPQTQKVSE